MAAMVRHGHPIASHVAPDAPPGSIRRDAPSVPTRSAKRVRQPVAVVRIGERQDQVGGLGMDLEPALAAAQRGTGEAGSPAPPGGRGWCARPSRRAGVRIENSGSRTTVERARPGGPVRDQLAADPAAPGRRHALVGGQRRCVDDPRTLMADDRVADPAAGHDHAAQCGRQEDQRRTARCAWARPGCPRRSCRCCRSWPGGARCGRSSRHARPRAARPRSRSGTRRRWPCRGARTRNHRVAGAARPRAGPTTSSRAGDRGGRRRRTRRSVAGWTRSSR